MYQARENPKHCAAQSGVMMSYADTAGVRAPAVVLPPASNRSTNVGQTTILIGVLAMDGAAGFGLPLLTTAQVSAQSSGYAPVILLTTVLTLCLIGLSGGYSPRLLHQRGEQVRLMLTACVTAIGTTGLAAWAFDAGRTMNLDWALPAAGFGLLGLTGGRVITRWLLTRERTGFYAPRTVVVGGGPTGMQLMQTLLSPSAWQSAGERVRLIGYIDDRAAPTDCAAPFLGGLTDLLHLIRAGGVDRVIIALPWSAQAPVLDLIRQLAECPVQIQLARDPNAGFSASHRPPNRANTFGGLVHLLDPPLSGLARPLKRGEDILIASIALIACLPIMAVIALLIRLDSPGPVLFRQRRTGFNNRDFQILKFRSMHHHLADHDAQLQVTHRDPRVTRIGAWLRRSSLDELPQIFNVLCGDMSIVGPRPHAPGTQAGGRLFDQIVAHYAARHRVRPGVTGLAQVRGLRGPTETEDKLIRRIDSDLEYIENWSVWLDLLVLARTAFAVLRMKNAC